MYKNDIFNQLTHRPTRQNLKLVSSAITILVYYITYCFKMPPLETMLYNCTVF